MQVLTRMITKYRLSDNASLGDVSTPISGSDSNAEETTCESMNRDDQNSTDQQSNDCGRYRRPESNQKKRLPGSLLSDDSCNAVDNLLGVNDAQAQKEEGCRDADQNADLSFDGKIKPLTSGDQNETRPLTNAIDGFAAAVTTVPEIPVDVGSRSGMQSREEKLNESFELLTKECNTLNHYNNEKSPDLFADEDEEEADVGGKDEQDKDNHDYSLHRAYHRISGAGAKELDYEGESSVDRTDHILLQRMKMSLSGIPPPPALTYSDIDVGTMLTIYRSNLNSWLATHSLYSSTNERINEGDDQAGKKQQCLMKPTHSTDELTNMQWPELTKHRAHGLHYNRSRVSETFELLGLKYVERYISAETSCSFNMTILQSSAKKRNQRLKMLNQSPGRRLSHLARRRATFSSESLLNTSGSKGGSIVSAGKGAIDPGVLRRLNPHRACNNRQLLLDPKKSDNRRKNKIKTPKRRTPAGKKSPRRRTPGSSAKKLSLLRASASGKSCTQVHVPATRESSKRALFLSPQNSDKLSSPTRPDLRSTLGSNSKQTERSIFSEARILKSKRSLFSQPHGTAERNGVEPTASSFNMSNGTISTTSAMSSKRRRSSITDVDDGAEAAFGERTEKIRRTECSGLTEEDLTPRSLKFARSKSFCVGLQSTGLPSTVASDGISAPGIGGKTLIRANSEISSSDGPRPLVMLTENHKKKLLWAVSQALQSKQITAKHELFKQHASNLVRVVKRLFLEFNDQTTTSTSEKLLKLANKHVYEVIQGKSVDDIYFREKTRIMNARNLPKLQGYIAPEEYELRKLKRTTSVTSYDGSSPFDCSLSASQSFLSQSSILSQGSSFGGLSQLSQTTSLVRGGSHMKLASSTGSVNTVGLNTTTNTALRENVDSELRQRSTKKQLLFSGKDQKNVSPFRMEKNLSVIGSNVNTNKLLVGGSLNSSIMKAKRQISFE